MKLLSVLSPQALNSLAFSLLPLAFFLLSCHPVKSQISFNNQEEVIKKPLAKIQFDSSTYHFGELIQGQLLKKEIWFTNAGTVDLQIELITACECTTLDWTRLPIAPGARSKISITYNSKDKDGPQIVDVEVIANTEPASTYSKFKLNVKK
ncbi:MAG: DUF1573 domain-containing protein [Saprospiraceae bacterium]|nr:DUF1573 domain-containing protein [Saprospiraceae bacterium]MBK6860145.1 DUF1573 domain-containing protein [Saprospiraceae bacterium]MBK8297092.1 DUF1573 domain-containing protein [Saprospiraceae bacterium]